MSESTPNVPGQNAGPYAHALEIARMLARAGVPIFVARAIPGRPGEFRRPEGWQRTAPDPAIVDTWRPGDALCAVGGGPADWLDCDAYNGGAQSRDELIMGGAWPTSYGQQSTPSGGTHDVIVPLRVGSKDGWMHGLDLKGGRANGQGRGYIYIEPTQKLSKITGEMGSYHWVTEPDMALLAECAGTDDTGTSIADRIGARDAAPTEVASAMIEGDPFAPPSRLWSKAEASAEVLPRFEAFRALRTPEDSGFNQKLNELAMRVGHFVPEFWNKAEVTGWLYAAAEHNRSVEFQGAGNVKATIESGLAAGMREPYRRRESDTDSDTETSPAPEPDAVDALLARMLDRDALDSMPPPRPLIHGVLERCSESWLIGLPGSLKSFVALDMAIHVALGRPWRGRRVEQGPVVYMAAEGGKGLLRRVRAWEEVYGERVKGLHFLPFPVQASDPLAWAVLVTACTRLGAVMTVLDTQARITVGMEENSNTDMGRLVESVRRLKEATDACVLVVHHTGRNGGDARGASALDGAQDTELRVDRDSKELVAVVSVDKQKDGDESATWDITMRVVELGIDEYGQKVTSLALEPFDLFATARRVRPEPDWEANLTDNQTDVAAALGTHGDASGATRAQARMWVKQRRAHIDRPDMPATSFDSAVRDLVARDVIVRKGARLVHVKHLDEPDK